MAKHRRRKSGFLKMIFMIPLGIVLLLSTLLLYGSFSDTLNAAGPITTLIPAPTEEPVTPEPMQTAPPMLTEEPTPTPDPTPVPTPSPKPTYYELPYMLEVNYKAQLIHVWTLDENGHYNTLVKTILTSTGKNVTCPNGVYELHDKRRWILFRDNTYGQYSARITGHILFHSLPYRTKRNDTLISENYDLLGTRASHGCMRMMCKDAKWIYDNCPEKTPIVIWRGMEVDDSEYTGIVQPELTDPDWDPTDPDPDNPSYYDESGATPPPTCCPNVTPVPWKDQALNQTIRKYNASKASN